MRYCPYCGHENREGIFFCEECGHGLKIEDVAHKSTQKFKNMAVELQHEQSPWMGTDVTEVGTLVIHIRNAADPLLIELVETVVLGRADTSSPEQPDIDLTPFGALEKGVSRLHAIISRGEDVLTLTDIGSSNGTYLNGQKLARQHPSILRDGDELRLGKLVAHVYFKSGKG